MFNKMKARVSGFAEEHPRLAAGAVSCGTIALGAASMLGQASAAVGNETVAFYGLSVVDWVLAVIGAIVIIAGLYLRHMYVIAVGAIFIGLMALANYVGL